MGVSLYCEKHEKEHGAGGCIDCIIDKMNKDGGGLAGGLLPATGPAMQRAMPAFQDQRELAEKRERERIFFEENKAFHENRLAKLSKKGGLRPLC